MKNLIITLVLSFIGISSFAQYDLLGKWNTGDQNTIVEITQQNSIYSGEIISSDNPKAKPGILILKDVKAKKHTWSGKVYSPRRGEWYNTKLSQDGNKLEMTISVGFFSKTLEWTRQDEKS